MMIVRRLCAALALLCLAWMMTATLSIDPVHANCSTPCTKTQINTDITTNWPDNTAGAITPALLRSTVQDLLNSYLDVNGSSTFSCATHQFLNAILTLSTYQCAQPAFSDISGQATVAQLPNGIANSIYINPTGSTAAMQNLAVPACANDGSHALVYVNASGLACATITTAAATLTEPQGRVTLTANTPVMTATASAQTTLRYDCYIGSNVPYYTGSADSLDSISSCEVTDAMVSAASAGQVVSGNVYDVWWVHGGANRICLAMSAAVGGGGGWSADTGGSNTARGTGYSQLDRSTRSYTTNKNSITNCFNNATQYGPVSANQGTYLGTVYASANGQISWTLGASASGGTAGLLGVWNMYNRVSVGTTVTDSGTSYTYASATIRQARGSAGNQIQFVLGLQEDAVNATVMNEITTNTTLNNNAAAGLGFDATNAFGLSRQICLTPVAAALVCNALQTGTWNVGVGLHTLSANENSSAGTSTLDSSSLNYLTAQIRM